MFAPVQAFLGSEEATPTTPNTELRSFSQETWHFCSHPDCRNENDCVIKPTPFYVVNGNSWSYFCSERHIPSSLKPPAQRKNPVQRKPSKRKEPHKTKAVICEEALLLKLQDQPLSKADLTSGIPASSTRIETVLRHLLACGQVFRLALGNRNTHLWYSLSDSESDLQGMAEDLKQNLPIGSQRQAILDTLESGTKSALEISGITGFRLHKVMYTTQALVRMGRLIRITSYSDQNFFSLPRDRQELVSRAWHESTDYKLIRYVEQNPDSYTRRIADAHGISFVRAKRILSYAQGCGWLTSKTSPHNHTCWQHPCDLKDAMNMIDFGLSHLGVAA